MKLMTFREKQWEDFASRQIQRMSSPLPKNTYDLEGYLRLCFDDLLATFMNAEGIDSADIPLFSLFKKAYLAGGAHASQETAIFLAVEGEA